MMSFKALAKSGAAARALTIAAVLSVGLSGCQILQAANILDKQPNKSIAAQGERIPVLQADDQVTPAAALKGQDFSLPQPTVMASWPVPGGTPEQSVEHVAAAAADQIAHHADADLIERRQTLHAPHHRLVCGRVLAAQGD